LCRNRSQTETSHKKNATDVCLGDPTAVQKNSKRATAKKEEKFLLGYQTEKSSGVSSEADERRKEGRRRDAFKCPRQCAEVETLRGYERSVGLRGKKKMGLSDPMDERRIRSIWGVWTKWGSSWQRKYAISVLGDWKKRKRVDRGAGPWREYKRRRMGVLPNKANRSGGTARTVFDT